MRFIFFLAAATSLMAQEAAPVRLLGPEVSRLAWDTGALSPSDFDGDGRLDVALVNNENAKVVILYQRTAGGGKDTRNQRVVSRDRWEPVLEDSRFEKATLPLDQRQFCLTAADFDGDGKIDLAMTGATDALTIRYQGKDATFSQSWKYRDFEPLNAIHTMAAADFDGDKKQDLAVLAKGKLLVLRQKPAGGMGLEDPVIYSVSDDRVGFLMAEDADNDGATDLIYISGNGEGSLRFRRRTGPCAFSSEVSLPYPMPDRGAWPSRDDKGRLILTRVHGRSQSVERHLFQASTPDALTGDVLIPTVYSAPGGARAAIFCMGDLDGDGLVDIAQADPKAAQVTIWLQQGDGSYAPPLSFPSLSEINGLVCVSQGAGVPSMLAVISKKEGFGLSKFTAEGRLEFPALQELSGKGPYAAVGSVDLKGDGKGVVVLVGGESRSWTLELISPSVSGKITLTDLKREPTGLKTGDLNGDGHPDLVLLVGKDAAMILLAMADGSGFNKPLPESPVIKSQLSDLSPERVTVVDIDGDKRAELITSGTGYARSLRLNKEGTDLVIADQYNARAPDDKLSTPAFADVDGDGSGELIFSENGGAWLQVLKRDAQGVYRALRRLETGAEPLVDLQGAKMGNAALRHLILTGKDRFWAAPLAGSRPRLELLGSYETDLKGCKYFAAVPGDLNGDGVEDLVAFDAESKLLEVLTPGAAIGLPWRSDMHFVLFEENIHFRGRKGMENVRETLLRDFTGDGKTDVLILVHDRVLLYPQG